MDVQAVFWDYGGVFTSSPFTAMAAYAADIGIEAQIVSDALFGPMHDTKDHPWHRLERGEVPLTDAIDHARTELAQHGVEFSLRDMFSRMAEIAGGSRPTVRARVETLHAAGMRQGIITNNLAEFRDAWRSSLPVDELFEDVVDSHEVGLRKPDPAIYQLAAERLDVDITKTVFLDDLAANVAGAEAVGMTAIQVGEDPASALEQLEAITGVA